MQVHGFSKHYLSILFSEQAGSGNDNSALLAEKAAMSTKITDLEVRLSKLETDNSRLSNENKELSGAKDTMETQLREASAKAANPEIAIALQRVQVTMLNLI